MDENKNLQNSGEKGADTPAATIEKEAGSAGAQAVAQEQPRPASDFARISEERRKAAAKKRRRKKIIKWSVIIFIVLAVAAASTYGIYQLFFVEETIEDQTTTSYRGPFSSSLSGYGQIKATLSEAVTVKARGELLELYVGEGDVVMAGDPLFKVDDGSVRESIATKQEEYATISQGLTDIYEKISKLNIYSPFAGRILDVKVKEGDSVVDGAELATIVDDSRMLLKQYFSYAFENDIYVGQTASVSIPKTMSLVEGTVTRIEKVRKVTQDGTVLFLVEITIPNPSALTKDMAAVASISGGDGMDITPAESGALEYIREEKITAEAAGKITKLNLTDYSDISSGVLVCALEGTSYDDQIKTINTSLAAKQEEIDELQKQLDSFNAVAPINGTVMNVAASIGQILDIGTAVLTVSDTTAMVLEVNFDERDINNVSVGQMVELIQETSEGERFFMGTVKAVSLEGKYEYGYATFPATISIEGGEGLYAGSSLRYSIMLTSKDDCVLLPLQAVKYTEQGTCVFIKTDERPENAIDLAEGVVPEGYFAVQVETGVGDESVIEIVSGIEDGVEVYLQPGVDPNQQGYYY